MKKPPAKKSDGRTAPGKRVGSATAPSAESLVSDSLRQEAERSWAASDRKRAKARRRTEARVSVRRKGREQQAEIGTLKEQLNRADRKSRSPSSD